MVSLEESFANSVLLAPDVMHNVVRKNPFFAIGEANEAHCHVLTRVLISRAVSAFGQPLRVDIPLAPFRADEHSDYRRSIAAGRFGVAGLSLGYGLYAFPSATPGSLIKPRPGVTNLHYNGC